MPADNGIIIGLVSDLNDPEDLGRIKVTYPTLNNQVSDWARLVTPMAGKSRGMFFRPEVGDEVLVGYEQGDPRRPYILGSLWSKTDPPPADDGNKAQNNWRFWESRSHHILRLDDTSGGEKIEIIDKDGTRKVVIDSAGSKIQILCDKGDIEVTASTGKVTITAQDITLNATKNLELTAGQNVTIKGTLVNIN
jgi:uncharacterized protein involved in type VI secretion and phage assembly